jgi:hypothetical protein
MRPVHIVILILAGALGGAGIMRVASMMKPAASTTSVAQVRPPAAISPIPIEPVQAPEPATVSESPAAEPEPAPVPAALPAKSKPSPMPMAVRREAPRPPRAHPVSPFYSVAPLVVPDPGPQLAETALVSTTTSPTVAPPSASTEPEHVTSEIPKASVAPAPQPRQVTLNAGLLLPVRLVDGLSSERNVPGDVFLTTLDQELAVDGLVIAERGARVEGRVVATDRSSRGRRGAALALELTRLHTADGQAVLIRTDSFFHHADATSDQNAAIIGGGVAIGAVIGAIAGGAKGAAIGAGAGGAAGAGDVLLSRGKAAEMPPETRVTFRLKNPVPLTAQVR